MGSRETLTKEIIYYMIELEGYCTQEFRNSLKDLTLRELDRVHTHLWELVYLK
jgi:hypothetical protein